MLVCEARSLPPPIDIFERTSFPCFDPRKYPSRLVLSDPLARFYPQMSLSHFRYNGELVKQRSIHSSVYARQRMSHVLMPARISADLCGDQGGFEYAADLSAFQAVRWTTTESTGETNQPTINARYTSISKVLRKSSTS